MADESWQKIREIFDSALRRKPAERRAFVAEACGADKTLLAEVESLLASLDSAESFLEKPAVAKIAGEIEPNGKRLEKGECLAHYEIIEQIGTGGMGEVYLAEDKKLDRRVAIKILNEKFAAHESNLRRFVREAKAASALNHPNILVIHEIGESENAHFIVSEFIKGKTLRETLREKSLKLAEVLDIAIQIANALAAAHEARLVHRDIKPENVMIRPDSFVKVLDFGLAKLVERKNVSFLGLDAPTNGEPQTGKGIILGTVNYMSPEQAKGERVDERTDIFSLGAIVYEMLTGRTPFAGESVSETFANLINAELQPLSHFVSNVPHELQRIISKMLRKNVDERYQTMKGILTDLNDLRETLAFDERLEKSHSPDNKADTENATGILQATTADLEKQTAETQSGFSGQFKRHKSFAATTALAVLLIGVIGFGYWFFTNRSTNTKRIESIAVLPFVNESGNAETEYLSDGMTETLISSLSQLPKLNVKARSSVFRYKDKEIALPKIGQELNVQTILTGRVVQRGKDLTLHIELVDAATENILWKADYNRPMTNLVALQSEIARDVSNKLQLKLSGADERKLAKNYTENAEAYKLYLQARFYASKRTNKDLEKSIEYFNQATAVDPNYALAFAGIADSYALLHFYSGSPAQEMMPRAKDAALKALLLDNDLAEAHAALGMILNSGEYDFAGAERQFKRAIELNPNFAAAHQYYAELLMQLGRYEEAIVEIRRALEIDPLSLITNQIYGDIFRGARRYDEAIAQIKKTLEIDPDFASAHISLYVTYWAKGNHSEAVEEYAKYQELSGKNQKAARSREVFAQAGWKGFLQELLREQRPDTSSFRAATLLAELGEKDKAFVELEKSYEKRESSQTYLKADPRLDPLRDDPRFQDLLRRVGLSE